jgi:hypothetical protein
MLSKMRFYGLVHNLAHNNGQYFSHPALQFALKDEGGIGFFVSHF